MSDGGNYVPLWVAYAWKEDMVENLLEGWMQWGDMHQKPQKHKCT